MALIRDASPSVDTLASSRRRSPKPAILLREGRDAMVLESPGFVSLPDRSARALPRDNGIVRRTQMGKTPSAQFSIASVLLSLCGCGGEVSSDGRGLVPRGTGGSVSNHVGAGGKVLVSAGGEAGAVASGAAGAAGVSTVCPVGTRVDAPTSSANCQVASRPFDPVLTCGTVDCAITKTLDMTCALTPHLSWLSDAGIYVANDSIVVTARTHDIDENETIARVMTVAPTDSRVEDLSNEALPTSSVRSSASSVSASGTKWMLASNGDGMIIAALGTGTQWSRMTVVPSSFGMEAGGDVTSASAVDDQLGYFTYSGIHDQAPHLVTWEGTCWADQVIGKPKAKAMVVAPDVNKQPWTAWISQHDSGLEKLNLRSPKGDTQELHALTTTDSAMGKTSIRLLPSVDGVAALPTVVVRLAEGIIVFSRSPSANSEWTSLVLPESAPYYTNASDCASETLPRIAYDDACSGFTICSGQASGAGAGFDIARTESGAVFVAWVIYSGQATYAPKLICYGRGQMGPECYCGNIQTRGSGTAELVIARLTESQPMLTHFHIDMGGAVWFGHSLAMAARGDTLVLAGFLRDQSVPTLTYLEIDSKMLH